MKKILYVMSLLIVASMVLAACGGKNESGSTEPSVELVEAKAPAHAEPAPQIIHQTRNSDETVSEELGAGNAHLDKCESTDVPAEYTQNLGSGFINFPNGGGHFWVFENKVIIVPDEGKESYLGCGKTTVKGDEYFFNGINLYTHN